MSSVKGLGYSKSFNDPGFVNMAMHTLVKDELKHNGPDALPPPRAEQSR